MASTYTLIGEQNGRSHFSRATVEAELAPLGVVVEWESAEVEEIAPPLGVEPGTYMDLKDHAQHAARAMAEWLMWRGDITGCHVTIKSIACALGGEPDRDVMYAVNVAMWQDLFPERDLPQCELEDGHWRVRYP